MYLRFPTNYYKRQHHRLVGHIFSLDKETLGKVNMMANAVVLGLSFVLAFQSSHQVEYAAVSESSPVGDQVRKNDALSRIFDEVAIQESTVSDSIPVDDTAREIPDFENIVRGAGTGVFDDTAGDFLPVSDSNPVDGAVRDVDDSGYRKENAHAFAFDDEATSQKTPAFNQMGRMGNSMQQDMARSQKLREGVPGPIGYIYHLTSGKLIHPLGGSAYPRDGTSLVTYRGGAGERRLQFRFIPVKGFGHYGFIEHVPSRAVIHPKGGRGTPGDDTRLVLHRDRHYGALFTFDEELERIVHIGGKFWHPSGGRSQPRNDNRVVVHGGNNVAARFYLGDANAKKISAYPTPYLSGTWRVLRAFINPKAPITYTETYREGMSRTKTTTREHSWKVSTGTAVSYFSASVSASAEYAGAIQHTSSSTWTSEHEASIQLDVPAGETVVYWQFIYRMDQYGEGYRFRSNIVGTSNSLKKKPVLF